MKNIIFSPLPNATPDEVMQVLKMFTFSTFPAEMKTGEILFKLYNELPPEAKRHFQIKESK